MVGYEGSTTDLGSIPATSTSKMHQMLVYFGFT